MKRSIALLAGLAVLAAATPAAARPGKPSKGEDIARARARKLAPTFRWEAFGKEAFDRARRERKPILIDCVAEWCHWCHVMDETTYRDPEIGRALASRFVAIRVDIDARPDIAERYADYGWPATILLSPDARELGKLRGYLSPERLREVLAGIEARGGVPAAASAERRGAAHAPASVTALPWIAGQALVALDGYHDAENGGWGRGQKAPLGANAEAELVRATRGDAAARSRAIRALDAQRAVMDPVWGGLYQYSTGGDWGHPHFEKLMVVQAPNLEAYARAHAITRERRFLDDARRVAAYLERHLSAPDGTFYVAQDADVGAHDQTARFVDGHVFFARDEAGRRSLGAPWVDTHVYARDNGLAIAALTTLGEVTADPAPLARARKAADALLASHLHADGGVLHDAKMPSAPRFLADAAAFGRALARLAEVTRDARYREAAMRVARAIERDLAIAGGEGLVERTADDAAAGAFAVRGRPLGPNVAAARFFAALARATGDAEVARGRPAHARGRADAPGARRSGPHAR
jgi:uncharacterized protein YyaL (SSP411 family)